MHFDGEFRVPGSPSDVLARFSDVTRMAQCMPGATIDGRDDAGLYLGSMLVAFGPKQIRFKGKVEATTDREALCGALRVKGAAEMKTAARAEVRVTYTLREDPAAGGSVTIVSLSSDAEMGGVLGAFAQTGGIVVTRALMEEFASRAAKEFALDAAPASVATPEAERRPMPPPATPRALPAWRIAWRTVRGKLLAVVRRPG